MIQAVTAVTYLLRDLTATAGMILFMRLVFRREVCFSVPNLRRLVCTHGTGRRLQGDHGLRR